MMIKSLLFIPAKRKMLDKVASFNADSYILDLEDSIIEQEKDTALSEVVQFMQSKPNGVFYVRLNKNRIDLEVSELKRLPIAGYMIPKVESPADLHINDDKFTIALIETALGLINCESIIADNKCDAVAFGAEDFTASTGMDNNRETLQYARSRLVIAAKAFKKFIYDTPCFSIDNMDVLSEDCELACSLGFNGKLAIHPKQIAVINSHFGNSDVESLRRIVDEYEASNQAVLRIGDKIYEKMHINHFKRIIKEQES